MGLFVADDGHYQGWLAAVLCCCVALDEDESPIERQKEKEVKRQKYQNGLCNDQPGPLSPLPSLHSTTGMPVFQDPVAPVALERQADSRDDDSPYADIHPSGALDLGSIIAPSRYDSQEKLATTSGHAQRPSISVPSSRRTELTFEQRQGLIPLRLGPVVLRDTPAPSNANSSGINVANDFRCGQSGRQQSTSLRDATSISPITRHSSASGLHEADNPDYAALNKVPTKDSRSMVGTSEAEGQQISTRGPSRSSSSSSQHLRGSSSISSVASKPSNDHLRPIQRKSLSSLRPYLDDEDPDLEREIIELNAVVEERRAEVNRNSTPSEHIPAIAPSMQVHARSETLTDIGSALSLARSARAPLPTTSRASMPPLPSTAHSLVTTRSKPRLRISGWLSGILPSTHSSTNLRSEPFYKCQAPSHLRGNSEGSFGSCDSPSLTAASLPTTKGHSRSQTGDSQLIATPSYVTCSTIPDPQSLKEGLTPSAVVVSPNVSLSRVGLAL